MLLQRQREREREVYSTSILNNSKHLHREPPEPSAHLPFNIVYVLTQSIHYPQTSNSSHLITKTYTHTSNATSFVNRNQDRLTTALNAGRKKERERGRGREGEVGLK